MTSIKSRIQKLRSLMTENNFDVLLVTKRENILYLSGFNGTSGCLLITHNETFLFTDFRYIEQATAQSPQYEIIKVTNGLMEAVGMEIKERLLPNANVAFENKHMIYNSYIKLEENLKGNNVKLLPAGDIIEQLRSIKEQDEVENISWAARIGMEALESINHLIKPGVKERDIALELEYYLKKAGAYKSAFDIIVASGKRSALPHGLPTEKTLEAGDPVVIDWGCQFGGYHSDCTRTFFVGKTGSKWLEIYDIVKEAQSKALDALTSHVDAVEVDKIARDYIKDKGYGEYFGHGLGHGVGLEVHEKPTLSPKGKDLLKAGMVVTVEPGIYLPGEGGVRLEELVLLTEKGPKVLTS